MTDRFLKNNKPKRFVIFLLFLGALTLRLVPLLFGTETTDILLYKQQAWPILQMRNIYYISRNVFPYTPISMFYPALCYQFSEISRIPFHIIIKFFAILSDVGIVLTFYIMGCRFLREKDALISAVLYALNPVSILICSFQGNIMPLTVLLLLASYFYWSIDREKNLAVSGLLLGMAVGWRTFPILLFPLFLSSMRGFSLKRLLRFSAYVILPSLISMVPFFLLDPNAICREIFGYNGAMMHHGPFAITRGLLLLPFKVAEIPFINYSELIKLFPYSKTVFLAMYGVIVLFSRKASLLDKILMTFFSFYIMYSGVASQYLVWVLPFLLLLKRKWAYFGYVITATGALLSFYRVFLQDLLFGTLRAPRADHVFLLHQWIFFEVLFTFLCVSVLLVLSIAPSFSQDAERSETGLCRFS